MSGNELTVEKVLADPESIDWSHRTVEGTEQLFNGLVEASKNGHWIEAVNVYFAIAKSGNMNLITSQRLMDIWKAEYMRDENGKPVSESKLNSIVNTYVHYFWNLLEAPSVSKAVK